MVDVDGIHPVVAETVRIVQSMAINGETFGQGVKSMESNFTTEPKFPVLILRDRVIVEAPTVVFWFESGEHLGLWIEMAKTLPRCAPERSVLLQKQAFNDAINA